MATWPKEWEDDKDSIGVTGYFKYGDADLPGFIAPGRNPLAWNGKWWFEVPWGYFFNSATRHTREEFARSVKAMGGFYPYDEKRAREFCEKAHAGQFRKDGSTPYAEHPKAVVRLLKRWGEKDPCIIAVAYLHDVLEDTKVTEQQLERAFAPTVSAGVRFLSHTPDETKEAYMERVAKYGCEQSILIKCADRICNTRDFIKLGRKEYAREYLEKARAVFDKALELGQGRLPAISAEILDRLKASLDRTRALLQ